MVGVASAGGQPEEHLESLVVERSGEDGADLFGLGPARSDVVRNFSISRRPS